MNRKIMTGAIVQTCILLILASAMGYIGYCFSKSKRFWWIGFCVPFVFVFQIILFNRMPSIQFSLILSWLGKGRNEFIVMSLCIPLLFGVLIPKLPIKRQRILLTLLAVFLVFYYTIPPFFEPALAAVHLRQIETFMDEEVCLQTTNYTCGAASAVTALRQLGIPAEESQLAIVSRTTPRWGTTEHLLKKAIEDLYTAQGISCECRYFSSIAELKDACPVIAVVKFRFLVDHFITVLEVTDKTVVIGDPLQGKVNLTYSDFADQWRSVGIIIRKFNRN